MDRALKRARDRVFRAALACVNKKGHAFLFARQDVNLYVIDRAKFQRLEEAVSKYREALKKWPRRSSNTARGK